MRLTLMFEGRELGAVDLGEPDAARGLRTGRLAPTAAYMTVRRDLQVVAEADLAALEGAPPETVRGCVAVSAVLAPAA